MRLQRVIPCVSAVVMVVAACTGGGSLDANDAGASSLDAGPDVATFVDAGGDCPVVCPPASTESFCDDFNRSDPLVATEGWHLTADSASSAPAITANPCGHLVVDTNESVQMLERTLAEAVNVIVTFDLTLQLDPGNAVATDAGQPSVTVLGLGTSDEAIRASGGVTVFFTATQVGVSLGTSLSVVNDTPPATARHVTLTITGRASNFSATATMSISGGPDVPPVVAQHFTAIPFKILQLGLRSGVGFGHASARIDNLSVVSLVTL